MGSEQPKRYIKPRMGYELKNKILQRYGIVEDKQSQPVSRTCGRCGHINNLQNKFCEKVGCSYPLTELAFQEIKATEEAKLQELITQSNLERDNTIHDLKEQMNKMLQVEQMNYKKYDDLVEEVYEKARQKMDEYRDRQEEQDERRRLLYDMLDKEFPEWGKKYHEFMGWGGRPLNKEERDKVKSLLEQLKNNPDEDDIGVPNRLKIRKQVGPNGFFL